VGREYSGNKKLLLIPRFPSLEIIVLALVLARLLGNLQQSLKFADEILGTLDQASV
jgi:hypothetical protein